MLGKPVDIVSSSRRERGELRRHNLTQQRLLNESADTNKLEHDREEIIIINDSPNYRYDPKESKVKIRNN